MADDFLESVLGEAEPVAPVEATEIQPAAEPAPVEQPAPVVPETPQEPVPQEAQQVQPDGRFVPISAVLDEREKRQAAEARARELEARQQPAQRPDLLDDPDGYEAYLAQELNAGLARQRFEMSDVMARQAHGAEKVDAAVAWAQARAQTDKPFAASYMQKPHPIDWIVQQHQRDALLSDIGDNLDDWFTREAAKRGYAPQSAPVAAAPVAAVPPAPKPVAPPRSIASDAPASAPAVSDETDFIKGLLTR